MCIKDMKTSVVMCMKLIVHWSHLTWVSLQSVMLNYKQLRFRLHVVTAVQTATSQTFQTADSDAGIA